VPALFLRRVRPLRRRAQAQRFVICLRRARRVRYVRRMMGPFAGEPPRSPFGDAPAAPLHGDLFTTTVRILRSGVPPRQSWIPVLLMALLLVLPIDGKLSPSSIAVIGGAILLRDLLRYAAVHALDCPGEDLLLLPFLRSKPSGVPGPREAWKEALVILSGPLLSIALVLVLALKMPAGGPIERTALTAVLGLNTFLLLPFGNFDGSRILNLVIFARSRIGEVVFLFVTALALAYVGFLLQSWLMAVFGALGIFGAYRRLGFRRVVAEFRESGPRLPSPIESLDDEQMYRLFHAARRLVPKSPRPADNDDPRLAASYAGTMRRIHADATIVFPSLPVSVLILSLYGATFVLAAITFFFVPR
jgi:hypothetical protein